MILVDWQSCWSCGYRYPDLYIWLHHTPYGDMETDRLLCEDCYTYWEDETDQCTLMLYGWALAGMYALFDKALSPKRRRRQHVPASNVNQSGGRRTAPILV